jgi:hypothetical protein
LLTKEQKIELLSAKNSRDEPGLCWAFDGNHPQTIQAFAEPVLSSSVFSREEKFELLAANVKGVSAFAMAHRNRKKDAVEAFEQVIRNSDLDEQVQDQLLRPP